MKKILSMFLVVFMLNPLITATVTIQIQMNNIQKSNQPVIPAGFSGNITNISIEYIVGGVGLTVTVKNNGGFDLSNLTITVDKTNGSLVRLKNKVFIIPFIAINESIEIHIQLFGIGLGKLTSLPQITIAVQTEGAIWEEVQVITKIIGPFTKIITTYFIDDVFDGYTLFSPEYSTKTFLINTRGEIVHTWMCNSVQGLGLLLLEDGGLLRTTIPYNNPVFSAGGMTGGVQLFNWNGTKLWQFNYSNAQHCLHHSIDMLPNGHILMVGWEYKTADEAIAAGRNPDNLPANELWPDHIIEIEPTGPFEGTILWEWHVWDHLIQDFDPTKENYGVVGQHPELVDINYGDIIGKERADWNHINSIDYNEQFDQILISARHQHEIWIIDHSTTTEEAAGHSGGRSGKGGDILYRYGNPEIYRVGNYSDRQLFGQHDAQWIQGGCPGEGHILLFNNGQGRPDGQYSSVEELIPPVDENGSYYLEPGSVYGPEEPVWIYTAEKPSDFFAGYLSSVQRLSNGNTLICDGDHGLFFEVTREKKIVWMYYNIIPTPLTNQVFKILCYASDYPGLRYLNL